MKQLIFLLALTLLSCEEQAITGHVVFKKRMDGKRIMLISNSELTEKINVTENCYNYFKVTDKVIYDQEGLHLIKRYGNN